MLNHFPSFLMEKISNYHALYFQYQALISNTKAADAAFVLLYIAMPTLPEPGYR
jgi:hypothetical protein